MFTSHAPEAAASRNICMDTTRRSPHTCDDPDQQLTFSLRILEHSACPLIVVDATTHAQSIVYASPAFERLAGYTLPELHGRPWTEFLTDTADRSPPAALDTGVRSGCEAHATLNTRHRSGASLWLDAKLTQIRNPAGLVTHHIIVLQDLTAERRSRADLEYRAYHDPLTGLANRHLLQDRFDRAAAHARRRGASFALVLLDLNGFKLINDRFGHDAGDELLRNVSAQLKRTVRAEDTVARLGGDEFALLVMDTPGSRSIQAVTDRIRRSLTRPIRLAGRAVVISCGAGHASFPDDGSELGDLLKVADLRLYAEKAHGQRRSATTRGMSASQTQQLLL